MGCLATFDTFYPKILSARTRVEFQQSRYIFHTWGFSCIFTEFKINSDNKQTILFNGDSESEHPQPFDTVVTTTQKLSLVTHFQSFILWLDKYPHPIHDQSQYRNIFLIFFHPDKFR